MKNILIVIFILTIAVSAQAQSTVGLSLGTSKSDRQTASFLYRQNLTSRWSLGAQISYGAIRYRFIDAIAITEGQVGMIGLSLGYKIAEGDRYRLDANLAPRYRRIRSQNEFETINSHGIEIDPNILIGLKLSDQIFFHSGVMLRTAMQLRPEVIGNEQLPSAILTNALSLQKGDNLISLKTYIGPMNGAGGDTEKFYWQVSLGYQFSLGKSTNSIPFFNF
ncbi:MAG: hypothetical protein R3B93_19980 [Bacteroidia bacterium]